MQFTIEARELTSEYSHRVLNEVEPKRTTIEADGPDDAITQFVIQSAFELVQITKPVHGQESIATAKSGRQVYLLRCYSA